MNTIIISSDLLSCTIGLVVAKKNGLQKVRVLGKTYYYSQTIVLAEPDTYVWM